MMKMSNFWFITTAKKKRCMSSCNANTQMQCTLLCFYYFAKVEHHTFMKFNCHYRGLGSRFALFTVRTFRLPSHRQAKSSVHRKLRPALRRYTLGKLIFICTSSLVCPLNMTFENGLNKFQLIIIHGPTMASSMPPTYMLLANWQYNQLCELWATAFLANFSWKFLPANVVQHSRCLI